MNNKIKITLFLSVFLFITIPNVYTQEFNQNLQQQNQLSSRKLNQKSKKKIELVPLVQNNDYEEINDILKTSSDDYSQYELDEAIFTAVEYGYLLTTQLLKDNGANIYTYFNGTTLMHVAARYGQKELLRYLLVSRLGADIIDQIDGATPLMYAANSTGPNQGDTILILLEYDADVNIETEDGETALSLAVKSGTAESVAILFKKVKNKNIKKEAAFGSLERDDVSILEAILETGYKPDGKYKDGETLLTIAAENSSTEHVRILLAYGADPNKKNDADQFPLILACNPRCSTILIVELIMAGADVDAKDGEGSTPYEECSKWLSCEDEVELLLAAGAKEI